LVTGRYALVDVNASGDTYTGYVDVTHLEGRTYKFRWDIGNGFQIEVGTGEYLDSAIAVDWGVADPAIYIKGPEGTLLGSWAAGKGSEILTPQE
jgi:hypothetical protein